MKIRDTIAEMISELSGDSLELAVIDDSDDVWEITVTPTEGTCDDCIVDPVLLSGIVMNELSRKGLLVSSLRVDIVESDRS